MSECVREMTLQEKAESIINLINHKDINAEYLYNWQIDAMKEALEKQIPKKPREVVDEEGWEDWACPECRVLIEGGSVMLHCWNCGQKLDWSVGE